MAYGYIPSPLGGRPSSLDIAKAARRNGEKEKVKRDAEKDQAVRDAGVTPQRRANRIDDAKFLEDFFSGEDHDFNEDRGLPPGKIMPIDKSEDEPLEEKIATRTPMGRTEAVTREENPVLSEHGTIVRDKIPDPYSVPSENTRLATHQDAKMNEGYQGQTVGYDSEGRAKRQKLAGNEDRTSEDEPVDKSEGESEDNSEEDQIELIRTTPPYYGRDGVYESYKFKTIEGKKHDDATLGAMRTPRMKAEVTGGERLPDESQSESYYAEWEHPVENTPKGRDKKALDAKLPTPWGKDSYARQSSTSDESLYEELDEDRRDSIGYRSDGYDVRDDWESTRKSESSPVAKSINQMIYDRIYGKTPYSIKK